jgi:hypothetical protein
MFPVRGITLSGNTEVAGRRLGGHRSQRARLETFALEIALPLECLEVIVYAVGGADPHDLADLADRRRVALLLDPRLDEVENLALSLS